MGSALRVGRNPWFVIVGAMAVATIAYGVVARSVAGSVQASAALPTLLPVFSGLALFQLLLGAFLMTRASRARSGEQGLGMFFGGTELASPEVFQVASIIALALIEGCAVLGFVLVFLGGRLEWYLPFGAASLAVILGIALPTGTRYWDARERADAGHRAPIE